MTAPVATSKMTVDKAVSLLLTSDRPGRHQILRKALPYAAKVRDSDPTEVREELEKLAANDQALMVDIVIALAALVDVDKTPSQMLAWMCPTGRPKPRADEKLCGTADGFLVHAAADEKPCRPCFAAFERETRPVLKWRDKGPAQCGTTAGWRRHKKVPEKPCGPCQTVMSSYWKDQYERSYRRVRGTPLQPAECPSRAGYDRHVRLGEDPCKGCIAERRRYYREYKKARYEPVPRKLAPCNTLAARRRHRNHRERCSTCWSSGSTPPIWYPQAA